MLEDQLMSDYKQAMKDKDSVKVSVLNFLRAQLKYAAIEKKKDKLDDADVIVIIKKQVKQRQDSIEQFEKGNRQDLAEKEKTELNILNQYLPAEMPETEIRKIIAEAAREAGAGSLQDMGKVMKAALAKLAGRADSKMVSDLVKDHLSKI